MPYSCIKTFNNNNNKKVVFIYLKISEVVSSLLDFDIENYKFVTGHEV